MGSGSQFWFYGARDYMLVNLLRANLLEGYLPTSAASGGAPTISFGSLFWQPGQRQKPLEWKSEL